MNIQSASVRQNQKDVSGGGVHIEEPTGYAPSHWAAAEIETAMPLQSESSQFHISKRSRYADMDTRNTGFGKRRAKLFSRIGSEARWILLSTIPIVIAIMSFLGFLWSGRHSNNPWHSIMVNQWIIRSVTISALCLRITTDLQAGVAAAMLASMSLETPFIRLYDAAQVSTIRTGNGRPHNLLIPFFSSMHLKSRARGVVFVIAALLLALTTALLQFTSTVLLSDIRLGSLPGFPLKGPLAYDFVYRYSQEVAEASRSITVGGWSKYSLFYTIPLHAAYTGWQMYPSYQAFGEFSKPLPSTPEGVDDTGILLRAFLPFGDAKSRQTIRNYTGKAMVLDSRVSCQKPAFSNLTFGMHSDSTPHYGWLSGFIGPSTTNVSGLWAPVERSVFGCGITSFDDITAICQLRHYATEGFGGGLLSQFNNLTSPEFFQSIWLNSTFNVPSWYIRPWGGMSYLVIQSKYHMGPRGSTYFDDVPMNREVEPDQKSPWVNLWYKDDELNMGNISLSLCYATLDSATLDVELYSSQSRTEPTLRWDSSRNFYTTPDVHNQMGELQNSSAESRGILNMRPKASWVPSPEDVRSATPFAAGVNYLRTANGSWLMSPLLNATGFWQFQRLPSSLRVVDITVSSLFHQSLNNTGSVARALSTVLTTVSSTSYFQEMPQFETTTNATQVFFNDFFYPQSWRGYVSVLVVVILHVSLVGATVVIFSKRSRYTLLGNYWQGIAQMFSSDFNNLLVDSSMAVDKEVKKRLKAEGRYDQLCCVEPADDDGRVSIVAR